MPAPTAKDCHILASYYEKLYKQKYGEKPMVNRYVARWGFDAVLQSMSIDHTKALLKYYFETESTVSHDVTWFFYNYDGLAKSKAKSDKDSKERARLREESSIRAQRWRERLAERTKTD